MIFIPLFAAAFLALIFLYCVKKYKETSYYKNTKHSYLSVLNNLGRYGEYLTFKKLEKFEDIGAKFLFNLYIPKSNGETTEIDMIMICSKGIFIFESKNYSGWIFGSENQKNWYQTLPSGKRKSHKEVFYNPIMQNRTHIKHLDKLIGTPLPMYSIVVFSDRCTFKDIQIESSAVSLVYLSQVNQVVSNVLNYDDGSALDENRILVIYDKLYPYTQVSEIQKIQHIQNIRDNKNSHYNNFSNNTQNLKCPKCGGTLVLRTAKRGANSGNQFYGCSNYPKCRYMENIK